MNKYVKAGLIVGGVVVGTYGALYGCGLYLKNKVKKKIYEGLSKEEIEEIERMTKETMEAMKK